MWTIVQGMRRNGEQSGWSDEILKKSSWNTAWGIMKTAKSKLMKKEEETGREETGR